MIYDDQHDAIAAALEPDTQVHVFGGPSGLPYGGWTFVTCRPGRPFNPATDGDVDVIYHRVSVEVCDDFACDTCGRSTITAKA